MSSQVKINDISIDSKPQETEMGSLEEENLSGSHTKQTHVET